MQDSWLTPEGGKYKHNEFAKNLLIEEMGFDRYLDFMQKTILI